ncbi:MAG: hypothetical protein J6K97_01580 [Clostridia bacterium]|nr:hypothetical protein [Clostridia bacterium]
MAENTAEEKKVEFTNANKEDLIRLFVAFYGEEHRDYITQTIKETTFIFASQMTDEKIAEFDVDEKCRPMFEKDLHDFKTKHSAGAYCQGYLDRAGNFKKCVILKDNYSNHQLIHEINHILEMHLISKNENGMSLFTGFDQADEVFGEEEQEGTRKYEAFNEATNEYITKRILAKMEEMGVSFSSAAHDGSSYGFGTRIADKFFEYFFPDLIECRISGKPMKFKELIGEETFDKLAENLDTLMSFGGIKVMNINFSLEEKWGREISGFSVLVANAEELLSLDLTEEERKFLQSISNFKKISTDAIERDRENERY